MVIKKKPISIDDYLNLENYVGYQDYRVTQHSIQLTYESNSEPQGSYVGDEDLEISYIDSNGALRKITKTPSETNK